MRPDSLIGTSSCRAQTAFPACLLRLAYLFVTTILRSVVVRWQNLCFRTVLLRIRRGNIGSRLAVVFSQALDGS